MNSNTLQWTHNHLFNFEILTYHENPGIANYQARNTSFSKKTSLLKNDLSKSVRCYVHYHPTRRPLLPKQNLLFVNSNKKKKIMQWLRPLTLPISRQSWDMKKSQTDRESKTERGTRVGSLGLGRDGMRWAWAWFDSQEEGLAAFK